MKPKDEMKVHFEETLIEHPKEPLSAKIFAYKRFLEETHVKVRDIDDSIPDGLPIEDSVLEEPPPKRRHTWPSLKGK